MKQLCLLLVLACLVGKSVQFCYWGIFNEGSETECVGGDGTRIAIGASQVKLNTQCVKCSCSGSVGSLRMSCCGYGRMAGVVQLPPGCTMAYEADGCTPGRITCTNPNGPNFPNV